MRTSVDAGSSPAASTIEKEDVQRSEWNMEEPDRCHLAETPARGHALCGAAVAFGWASVVAAQDHQGGRCSTCGRATCITCDVLAGFL